MDRRNGSLGSYLRKSPLNISRQRMSSIALSSLLNANREPHSAVTMRESIRLIRLTYDITPLLR